MSVVLPAGVTTTVTVAGPVRRAGVERRCVQLPLERRLARGHEVQPGAARVQAANRRLAAVALDVPVAGRQRPQQRAVAVVQVQVRVAAALRGPNELPAASDEFISSPFESENVGIS